MVMLNLLLFSLLFMLLTQAQDDKCVIITNWDAPASKINLPSMTGSVLATDLKINSFAPDRVNNIVYGLGWDGDLYTIDMCGNSGKSLIKAGVLDQTWGLAYTPNTQLFYAIRAWSDLYTIDPNNNYVATLQTTLSHPFESLVFNKDYTKLYVYTNLNPSPGLYTVDITSSYSTIQVAPQLPGSTKTRSIDWENENNELKMIIPTTDSGEFYSLELATNSYTKLPGSYPISLGIDVRGLTIFYDDCDAVCSKCADYRYHDFGIAQYKTWSEANDYCIGRYGTELATITTQSELDCALDIIADASGTSAWIGLNSLTDPNGADYTYLDNTICPIAVGGKWGQCVSSDFWRYQGRPRCPHPNNNEDGTRCVRLIPDPISAMDNDHKCDSLTVTAILCNSPSS